MGRGEHTHREPDRQMTGTQRHRRSGSKKQRQVRPAGLRRARRAGCPPAQGPEEGRPGHLVTEDLDLADSAVHQALGAGATVVGVDLQVQGDALHPLLGGEVCAEAVDANKHLGTEAGAR